MRRWLEASCIDEGPLFWPVHVARAADVSIDECSIRRLLNRAALRPGAPPEIANRITGHSLRLGAAQDMLEEDFDSVAIITAGGWKARQVILRYLERICTQAVHQRRWVTTSGQVG